MVNSFRSELAHKKTMFALLTNETLTQKFPAAEKKAISDHVPWTRLVSATKTTYHGKTIDLQEYILKHRENLVLKPNDDYTGQGSFFGWETNDSGWERALRQAMRAPYVVQEKVEPARSVFPIEEDGTLDFREMQGGCVPAGLYGEDPELLELAVVGLDGGIFHLRRPRSHLHSRRRKVAGSLSAQCNLGPQIRHTGGVARIGDGDQHRLLQPIVTCSVGVVRRHRQRVILRAEVAIEAEGDPYRFARRRVRPASPFPAPCSCRILQSPRGCGSSCR